MGLSVLEHRDQLGVQPGRLFINGAWGDASDGGTWEQRNPATNEVVTTFAVGTTADVDRAVAAARRAFDEGPWPRLTAKERKKYFNRLVALITEHGEELNNLQTLEMGMPIARLVAGGDRPGGELAQGNFVNPTLFADVDNTMSVARDEIFGPVLVAMPFDDEEHAIALANDTPYGLGAGVYTKNIARAFRVARDIRAGTVGINEYTVWPNAPFGGYKQSGLGREGGWGSIEAFTETKSVIVGLSG